MSNLSLENVYTQLLFGIDLASGYLTSPVVILILIGGLFVVWRLLTPHR